MSRWENKYVIGLTGNIATGKSVVRQMLQHLGAYTVDADGLAHQAMQPGAPAYKPIVEKFGAFILDEEKRINRKMLGNIVFSNPAALAELERITHPVIRQAVYTLVARSRQRVVVIEAIKLLEGELANDCDVVWVVDAAPSTQLARLTSKRKMTDAEASQRMKSQSPQADKLARADVVIKNDGNVEETWKQVQAAWEDVKQAVIDRFKIASATPADAKPAAPQPAASKPAAKAEAPDEPGSVEPSGEIAVKRGMPTNAENIAQFISTHSDREVNRMDIMMAFGQKSYLLAQDSSENTVGVMGWQVENLITRADEFYIDASVAKSAVIQSLVASVETASEELQSEVAFIFLPESIDPSVISSFQQFGYEPTGIREIKIPAWREAVQETVSENEGLTVLQKKLREDRILKPI